MKSACREPGGSGRCPHSGKSRHAGLNKIPNRHRLRPPRPFSRQYARPLGSPNGNRSAAASRNLLADHNPRAQKRRTRSGMAALPGCTCWAGTSRTSGARSVGCVDQRAPIAAAAAAAAATHHRIAVGTTRRQRPPHRLARPTCYGNASFRDPLRSLIVLRKKNYLATKSVSETGVPITCRSSKARA